MRAVRRDIVGAFIFSNDGQTLLGKTRKGGAYQGVWVVAGGGIEPGETQENAVQREIMEELAIDVSSAKVSKLPWTNSGQSQKTLRENDETVMVDMTFYDFRVDFDKPAKDIPFSLDDDLVDARWFALDELKDIAMSPATMRTFQKLGMG